MRESTTLSAFSDLKHMLIKDVEIINIFTNFAWIDTHTHTCYGFQIFLMNNSEEAVGKCLLTCSASNVKRIFSVFRRSRHREDRQTARDRGKDCKTLGHTDEWNWHNIPEHLFQRHWRVINFHADKWTKEKTYKMWHSSCFVKKPPTDRFPCEPPLQRFLARHQYLYTLNEFTIPLYN